MAAAAVGRDIDGTRLLAGAPLDLLDLDAVCEQVQAYYEAKLAQHGASPRGVGWSCTATQWLRFVQLLKICSFDTPLSLIDLGCGYGALVAFLADRYPRASVSYLGIDLSPAMVRRARRRYSGNPEIRFRIGRSCPQQADYTVASGIMNIRLGCSIPLWESLVRTTLVDMRRMSRRGFAVNFLAASPVNAPPEMLYCPHPATWSRFCEEVLGCAVEVRNDYGLREFTLLACCQ
jgi:SAM-dependent methyltransferase